MEKICFSSYEGIIYEDIGWKDYVALLFLSLSTVYIISFIFASIFKYKVINQKNGDVYLHITMSCFSLIHIISAFVINAHFDLNYAKRNGLLCLTWLFVMQYGSFLIWFILFIHDIYNKIISINISVMNWNLCKKILFKTFFYISPIITFIIQLIIFFIHKENTAFDTNSSFCYFGYSIRISLSIWIIMLFFILYLLYYYFETKNIFKRKIQIDKFLHIAIILYLLNLFIQSSEFYGLSWGRLITISIPIILYIYFYTSYILVKNDEIKKEKTSGYNDCIYNSFKTSEKLKSTDFKSENILNDEQTLFDFFLFLQQEKIKNIVEPINLIMTIKKIITKWNSDYTDHDIEFRDLLLDHFDLNKIIDIETEFKLEQFVIGKSKSFIDSDINEKKEFLIKECMIPLFSKIWTTHGQSFINKQTIYPMTNLEITEELDEENDNLLNGHEYHFEVSDTRFDIDD